MAKIMPKNCKKCKKKRPNCKKFEKKWPNCKRILVSKTKQSKENLKFFVNFDPTVCTFSMVCQMVCVPLYVFKTGEKHTKNSRKSV
jgi:hypothetical protein